MLFLNKENGESLIGLLVATVIMSLIIGSLVSYMVFYKRLFASYDKMDLIERLLSENVAELEAKSLDDLPKVDKCLLKTYNLAGDFISESNASCNSKPKNFVDKDKAYVLWKVQGQEEISANFSHSNFMKLPVHSESIRQFILEGHVFDSKTQDYKSLNIIYFKKL